MKPTCSHAIDKGFSLLELLSVIAIAAALAAVSFTVYYHVDKAAKKQKLTSDVQTLNRALVSYVASGGSLDTVATAEEALEKLLTVASDEKAKRLPGFSSSLIDTRVTILPMDDLEADSDALRAVWDISTRRFALATEGYPGIKAFDLDDSLAERKRSEEDRKAMELYASSSTWVWDYSDETGTWGHVGGPSPVKTTTPPQNSVPVDSDPPEDPPEGETGPTKGTLTPPSLSVPGSKYAITDYDLVVSILDPNPPGISKIVYSIDYGPWLDYTGSISVSPESNVRTQAESTDTERWNDSSQTNDTYGVDPAQLLPPLIDPDKNSFGYFTNHTVTVTLADVNDPAISRLEYRIDGGSWMNYDEPFALLKDMHPDGATIESRAMSIDSPYYTPSLVSIRYISPGGLDITGMTSGSFHDPEGGSNMQTNLGLGESSDYFDWGNGSGNGMSESWMNFQGVSFANVSEGERFNLGSLEYYNGTIWGGTGADLVDLDISLAIDLNGNTFNPFFDFTFDLINTSNANIEQDPWSAADYVRLSDAQSNRTLVINDLEYNFSIEFGEATSDGFSLFDEFHVLENRDAIVSVYGTFTMLGPIEMGVGGAENEEGRFRRRGSRNR